MTQKHSFDRVTVLQQQIIEHVMRNQMSTNATIRKSFFHDKHASATTRCTASLCEAGWLNSYPLVHPEKYFRLGRRAAIAFGRSVHSTLPLGPQALPNELALLRYVTASNSAVQRVLADELQERYPWFENGWLSVPHCLRRVGDQDLLELVRVDLGGTADYQARKCRKYMDARIHVDELRELLRQRSLQMVIVTTSKEKAARLRSALDAHQWPEGMAFRIAVFSDLISVIPSAQ